MEDLAARIRAVLKTAPKLDWALWAALYAGLSEPERTKDLLQILPEGSVQARIAEVERKAKPATEPATAPSVTGEVTDVPTLLAVRKKMIAELIVIVKKPAATLQEKHAKANAIRALGRLRARGR